MATDLLLKIEQCKELSSTAKSNIITWLTHEKFSAYLSELEGLIQNKEWQLLEDAFFRVIPFGTGGRRGTVGIGSNRINDVTVGEVAQAVCIYPSEVDDRAKEKGVVIAYDSRNTSRYLTELFAGICAANGYRVYVYKDVRSTPQLSFSVRMLGTAAGIVVSASHNPSPDNGVKVYWNDGGQMIPPYDKELLAVAEGIEVINTMSFSGGLKKQLIVELEGDADEAYYQAVLHQAKQTKEKAAIIAYSPN